MFIIKKEVYVYNNTPHCPHLYFKVNKTYVKGVLPLPVVDDPCSKVKSITFFILKIKNTSIDTDTLYFNFQVSFAKIGVLLLVLQDQLLAETVSPSPNTYSSIIEYPTTKDTVQSEPPASDSNNTMSNETISKLENKTEDPIKDSVGHPVKADIENPAFSIDPLVEHDQRIGEDVAGVDSFSMLFKDPFFDNDSNRAGENDENKSSDNDSDGPKYPYGDTIERKFSNRQVSYGEKSGYQSGENLEFGAAQNKATGAKAVGISVGKGTIYGQGAAMVSGNGGKSSRR